MSNKQNKIGFKESVRLLTRGYKMIDSMGKHALRIQVMQSILGALYPFINIYLSAQIINELVGGKDVSRLTMLVWITIGANLICLACEEYPDPRCREQRLSALESVPI